MMKALTTYIFAFTFVLLISSTAKAQAERENGGKPLPQTERRLITAPDVIVTLVTQGTGVSVRGWEHSEVLAKATQTRQIEFLDEKTVTGQKPASRVLLVEINGAEGEVELSVPRGATVYVRPTRGNISIQDVAEVRVEAGTDSVKLRRIARAAEVTCIRDILIEESSGNFNLRTVGGIIKLSDVRPSVQSDSARISTVSGNILLDNISLARVEAETVGGTVIFNGPLAVAGRYSIRAMTGNVELALPVNSLFQIIANVGEKGRIVNEFPLKSQNNGGGSRARRLVGSSGTGGAMLNLSSFSGEVRLRRLDAESQRN